MLHLCLYTLAFCNLVYVSVRASLVLFLVHFRVSTSNIDAMALRVERRTSDQEVVGSTPAPLGYCCRNNIR